MAFAALPGAASAATEVVQSGPLRAEIKTSPWSLRFVQAGGPTLTERAGAASSPYGALGFGSTPTPPWGGAPSPAPGPDWWHATQVMSVRRSGAVLSLTVATNDPLGRRLDVSVAPAGTGVIAVRASVAGGTLGADVTQMADSFGTDSSEHFSGFGGRENLLDQAGSTVENWSEEGTWLPSDRQFIPPFIEPWTFSARDDGAYFPMPWVVSSRGYGFLLDDTERSLFRLRTNRADAWDAEVDATHIDYRVFAGPQPLDVVRRFSASVGRQPSPRAPWVLGPWWQPTGPNQATLPAEFRRQDVPGSLIMTYTHYLPGGGQNDVSERALVNRIHGTGYAVTTYFNPMISVRYQPLYSQAQSAGALLDNRAGQPYPLHYNQYVTAEVDFTAPAGRALYQRLLGEAVANGYDGWMEDFGEYTPPDALAHDGTAGSALHNLYPRLYHCTAYALTSRQPRPVIEFDRSGWTGSAACTPVVWSGDPTTDWDHRRRAPGDGGPGAQLRLLGARLLRVGHRWVLLDHGAADEPGAAVALARARGVLGRDADRVRGLHDPAVVAATRSDLGSAGRADLAALREAPDPAVPVPGCGGEALRAHRGATDGGARARLPARRRELARAGPVPVRPGPAGGADHRPGGAVGERAAACRELAEFLVGGLLPRR